jgi:hypothetical protein
MGGLTFLVDGKMCVGVLDGDLMVRFDLQIHESALEREGCREMDFASRPLQGFVLSIAGDESRRGPRALDRAGPGLNPRARASKKKRRPGGGSPSPQ